MTALERFVRNWVLPFADPRRPASVARLPEFFRDFLRYRQRTSGEVVRLREASPCLLDRTARTPFDPHYFYQGAWLARRLADQRPAMHVDVGSSVLMISVLSGQVPILFVDYRPLNAGLPAVTAVAANITELPFADGSIASLSSLHVVEHVGLGRYGDPLNPEGSRQALRELARVLAPGGRLYLSVPVGRERVCFNAHRVISPDKILGWAPGLYLEAFALVDDQGRFSEPAPLTAARSLEYGCGLFVLSRS
ncbi:MAG TPA: DUF268 domain-containing protein [Steroidobacteraceae bacterium]|nr:DUF268 domain-containing protein [Steroidobacteraceae bacterium]